MEYDRLKKRYFLELQEQLAKSERRHAEEIEQLSQQLSHQIQYNNTLLEHLQQLEQQQQQAQTVVNEAKKLLAKTVDERDGLIGACEKLQTEHQELLSKLGAVIQERDDQIDENKTLDYDNKLFRDELLKVKEDIAKYKQHLENNPDKLDGASQDEVDDTTKELLESQETLYAEIEALRSQLKQLSASVAMERDRVEVLDLQLNKEREGLALTQDALKLEQGKHQSAREECSKWASQFAAKDNEAKSLALDVDFLQNELKTAHKQAANYALERDERATMCDALTAHSNKLMDKINGLESEVKDIHKDADIQRERYENDIQLLRDDNDQLVAEIQGNTQAHKAELAQKQQEFEEMKHNYEESMREYCVTLTQQCAGIQATLQEELRKILAEKAAVVQAAREDKVNLEAQIALIGSKLATSEALARETESKYKNELEILKRDRDYLQYKLSGLQAVALEGYESYEMQIKECKELCVSLMSHYNALLASVSPLPTVIQSLCNDQNAQTEVSLNQIENLSQQYTALTHQLEKTLDEKQMLDVLLEEEKTKTLMLQESNSNIQHMLQSAQAQGVVAQELSMVVDSKTQEANMLKDEIQALNDELQQQRVAASSLLAKLDVAHCQLQIVNEENERSLNTFAESTMQHSHQIAELEEKLHATQAQLQSALLQRDVAVRDGDGLRNQLEDSKAQLQVQVARAAADSGAQGSHIKDLQTQLQDFAKTKAQAADLNLALAETKTQTAHAQGAVLALQEQRKQLQSENIELKEELEHLYKHQQMLTSLQQQQQSSAASRAEPKMDASIVEALKKQNRLIEDKCRMLQDNSMKMMKDFTLPNVQPVSSPQSPDVYEH